MDLELQKLDKIAERLARKVQTLTVVGQCVEEEFKNYTSDQKQIFEFVSHFRYRCRKYLTGVCDLQYLNCEVYNTVTHTKCKIELMYVSSKR